MSKVCSRCNIIKSLEEFNKRSKSKDGRHSYCRECQSSHYNANRVRHAANVKASRELAKANLRDAILPFLQAGCVDCGNEDIRVLDFDHVRGTKTATVTELIRHGRKVEVVLDEVAKCDVRCKNCHAIKTYERLGGSWRDLP